MCSFLRHKPAFVKYQFYDKPAVVTPAVCNLWTPNPSWKHTRIILLGTIDRDILLEYLRGPPLLIEVHDHDEKLPSDDVNDGAIFGSIWSDPLIGTCTYSRGMYARGGCGVHV